MLGLDNAGKSSIVKLAVDKMLSPLHVPTKGAAYSDIDILGQKIIVHDLGGQKKYRINYLQNPAFFDETDTFVYVVDLQDPGRYELALEYFDESLGVLDEFNISPVLFLLFHKFDGDYLEDFKNLSTRVPIEFAQLRDSFKETARKHGRYVVDSFQTSIRDEWGCFLAFSRIWSATVPRAASIQNFLDTLVAGNAEVSVALVVDSNSTLIAKAFRLMEGVDPEAMVNLAARSVLTLIDWQENIDHREIGLTEFAIVEMGAQSIMIQKIKTEGNPLFLLVLAIGGNYKELQARFAGIALSLEGIV